MSTMNPDNKPTDAPAKPGESAPAGNRSETGYVAPDTAGPVPRPAAATGLAPTWIGTTLGKYRILDVLGQGGMGVVLKAHDPLIERDVAIKVLADHLAADSLALARFLAEARAAGKLNHPNVVTIYEIYREGDAYYLILEYVPGGSVNDRLGQGPLPVLEATQALIDACKGVGAAHAAGLIHRDIKPANFMRAADGSIKVSDFGLAKAAADATRRLTQTGMVVGTPDFMSPEQCEAKPLDQRTDIYSLGATYYCLLTGVHPYHHSDSIPQLMYLHCRGPIPDPRSIYPGIPEACSRVVGRALAKAPADRYQSAAEMLADLQAVAATLSGQPPTALPSESGKVPPLSAAAPAPPAPPSRRRRLPLAVGGSLGVLALVAAAVLLWRPWEKSPHNVPGGPPGGEPVNVGVLHSLSGTMANSEAPVVDAVQFALDEVNQAGGVLGRPVKGVVADGRSDNATFAREAERLLDQEKVGAVFGCWTSASRKTVKPIFEEHDNLLVYPVQFEGLETSPCIVYVGAAPNQQILPAVRWAETTLHKKRFFLVGSDYVFPHAANAIIKDHLRRAGGEMVGEEYLPLGSQKVEAIVTALRQAKPDMILNTINGDSNVAFFRALREADVKAADTPTLSFSIGEQGLQSLNPADLEGHYAAWTYFQSVPTPENEDFVRRFQEKYPRRKITDPMETAYVGVKLWAQAVNEAQSLEPRKVRRALLGQHLQGPGGEVRIDPDTQYCYRTPRIAQVQADGQFKVVWSAPEPVRPEPYPNTRTAEAWQAFLHDLYTGWGNRWAAD
jgi:urea transport system substrate-binding protein